MTEREPGQWWVQTDKQNRTDAKYFRVFFCGKDSKNRLIFEDADGNTEADHGCDWSGWHHEPACTGWDWVPETFPQWYVSDRWEGTAYIKRVDAEKTIRVALDGKEKDEKPWSTHGKECLENGWYTKTTKADAEARVTKTPKAEPVESPDDWVTQDRVIARKGVDEYRWIGKSREKLAKNWTQVFWPMSHDFAFHGRVDEMGDRFEVRCRRKDLPVVEETLAVDQSKLGRPEEKRPLPCSYCSKPEFKGWHNGKCPYCGTVKPKAVTVTVYEVLYGDEVGENGDELTLTFCTSENDVNRIREVWKYVSVVSTKTVEVML